MQLEKEKLETWGLTTQEAKKRLNTLGYNEILTTKKISKIKIFLEQFNDFIVWILIAATIISGIMGDTADAITIIAIILLDAILGFIQEYRTEKSLEELRKLTAHTAKVFRDGKMSMINANEIVIGDIIEVETGDRIPADALIISCESLKCDEAILTGESVAVDKKPFVEGKGKNKNNMIYMGCNVTNGKATAKVIATGMNTEMGKIANMLSNIESVRTPLQERLDRLGQYLVYGCLIVCGIVTVTGVLRGENIYDMFLVGVSLAVAAIPEGLPAIVTVSLALGVQRMVKKNALVKKLPAVETLGCTNVICSDKTGTLTQNKMTVTKILTYNKEIEVTGTGYDLKGEFIVNKDRISIKSVNDSSIHRLLEACLLCNNSYYKSECKRYSFYGDPTEIALLVLAHKAEYESRSILKYKRIKEIPFNSERKMMSVVVSNGNNKTMFTKGALESVLNVCTHIQINNNVVPLDINIRKNIIEKNNSMASQALRVIAFAYKDIDKTYNEENLIFLGLVGMIDPPRREVLKSVVECKMAGIKPVMITGDHKLTAESIANELKIINKDDIVVTGQELDGMSDKKLDSIIDKVSVFARVNPEHKYRIVKAYKRKGYIVAMTGDGVNDAPAIKEADIGVAMGIQGTDVTKEAAAMILLDDNFSTIVEAVKEGRVIYDNIRKFIRYLLSCNIGEVLTMFLSTILNLPIPLLPIQILFVNLATDGLPAMALSLEKAENNIMMRKPRDRRENIFSDGLWFKIINRGTLIGICTVLSFEYSLINFGGDIKLSRTIALSTLIMSQLFHVFECRSEKQSVFKIGLFSNMYLVLAVLSSLIMLFMVIYFPIFQNIFNTTSLGINHWIIVLICSGLISLVSSVINLKKNSF